MTVVAEIPKNRREVVRVAREFFAGHDVVNIRTFYFAVDDALLPGKQGLALRAQMVPQLIEALFAALEAEGDDA